jgi:hypothetical protein
MGERRQPTRENCTRPCDLSHQHETERLQDDEERRDRQHPDERERGVRLEDQAKTRARLVVHLTRRPVPAQARPQLALGGLAVVAGRGPPVEHARGRGDDDAGAGEPGAPAQVDVVGTGKGCGVESAELVEEIGAHEHRRVRHVEDVAHTVVLFLVDLVGLDAGERLAVVVDRHAHFEKNVRIITIYELRTNNAGIRPVCLLHEQTGRVGVEHDVVVTEQEEDRTLDRGQGLVGRRRETAVERAAPHERTRQRLRHPVGGILGRRVVEDQDRQRRIVLGTQGRQTLLEPVSGVVGHNDRDHGRNGRDRFGLVVTLEQLGADRVGVDRVHEAGRG